MKVCIGGTFNILHKGHKFLFKIAFQVAGSDGKVYIGLSDGKLLENKKFVNSFEQRTEALTEYLNNQGFEGCFEIKPIFDKYGFAADGNWDAIVVSPETLEKSRHINEKRIEKGLKPLIIVEVPYVLADDNLPISSTRIYNKEIDEEGKSI